MIDYSLNYGEVGEKKYLKKFIYYFYSLCSLICVPFGTQHVSENYIIFTAPKNVSRDIKL